MIREAIGPPVRRLADSLLFHSSFALAATAPWLLEYSGALDLLESLGNWRGSGFAHFTYWIGGRA